MLSSAEWQQHIKCFFLEQIVMVYLGDRGHLPVKVIKKFISYTDCKVSVYCPLNIIWLSLLNNKVTSFCSRCYSKRFCKYSDIFMYSVHINFQVCAKVHEANESTWLQGQECLWCAPDSSCPENRTAASPEHTASTTLLTEQLFRSGMNFAPGTWLIFL